MNPNSTIGTTISTSGKYDIAKTTNADENPNGVMQAVIALIRRLTQ